MGRIPPLLAIANHREHISSTDMALIGIIDGNTALPFLLFKFLQLLEFVLVELRRRESLWAFPYTLISLVERV
jgi:hypothetical protein